jgi:L-iditol 2-dehydrogenase
MKVAILTRPYNIEIIDVEKPAIGNNDVLIKVIETGICGSDLHTYEGIHPFRKPPVILGHEVAGDVVEIGKEVKNIDMGTRVAIEPQKACGVCSYCKQGRYNICPERLLPGVGGWMGTFAEYFVSNSEKLYPLNEKVSYSSGVLAEPIAVGLHGARRANVKESSTLVLGLGSIGISAAFSAKILGAKQVVATDIAKINLQVAKNFGVDIPIDVTEQDLITSARKYAKEGFDSVIVTSGYEGVIDDAISLSKRVATIVIISLFANDVKTNINQLVIQEKEILGSSTYTSSDFRTVVDWLNNGELKPDSMITHKMPLEKTSEAFNILDKRTEPVIKIILKP